MINILYIGRILFVIIIIMHDIVLSNLMLAMQLCVANIYLPMHGLYYIGTCRSQLTIYNHGSI